MGDLDLAELRNTCLTNLYSCTHNVSKYMDDQKEDEFNKFRDCVKEYCRLELQQEASERALEIVQAQLEFTGLESLDTQYKQELKRLSKSNNVFDKHTYMKELEKHIKEADKTNRAGNEEDTDLAIVEVQSAHIDPISQRRIVNPMRNKICKHVYEKDTIESFIKNNKKGCPYVGCTNKQRMKNQDLFYDTELKNTLDTAADLADDSLSQNGSVMSDQ